MYICTHIYIWLLCLFLKAVLEKLMDSASPVSPPHPYTVSSEVSLQCCCICNLVIKECNWGEDQKVFNISPAQGFFFFFFRVG